MSELRMNAYYYAFEPTGVVAVDRILSAVAAAGKAYHHTEDWCDPGENGLSNVDYIQQAAADAAAALTAARNAALEEAARLVETQQEAIRETDEGTERYTSPRWEGNQAGLAFATAIRALKGEAPPS